MNWSHLQVTIIPKTKIEEKRKKKSAKSLQEIKDTRIHTEQY